MVCRREGGGESRVNDRRGVFAEEDRRAIDIAESGLICLLS